MMIKVVCKARKGNLKVYADSIGWFEEGKLGCWEKFRKCKLNEDRR